MRRSLVTNRPQTWKFHSFFFGNFQYLVYIITWNWNWHTFDCWIKYWNIHSCQNSDQYVNECSSNSIFFLHIWFFYIFAIISLIICPYMPIDLPKFHVSFTAWESHGKSEKDMGAFSIQELFDWHLHFYQIKL
jgi:hypothetical protein